MSGFTAESKDFSDKIKAVAPLVFGFVLVFAFGLLLFAFRSLVIAAKAIVLNLLSVAAAYGILVLVFQHGFGKGLLGFDSTAGIDSFLPIFIFVILFGLSMDYHVFILSRIREAYDRGMSTEEAVTHGIKSTAGVVTSAAIVMVCVFSVFATLQMLIFKQFGVGLAAAILIDATVVRAVLLPASMKLLGDWNWYLPSWLEWLPHLEHGGSIEPVQPRPPVKATSGPWPNRPVIGQHVSRRQHHLPAGRARGSRFTRDALVAIGVAVIAVHIADDNFVQPQPGTSAREHLASGLVPLALLALAAVMYPRLSGCGRAAVALTLGVFGVVAGVEAAYYTIDSGPSGDDYTGLLSIPAGLMLVTIGLVLLWTTRRRDGGRRRRLARRCLIGAASIAVAFYIVLPIGISYVSTHIGRLPATRVDLGPTVEDVDVHDDATASRSPGHISRRGTERL